MTPKEGKREQKERGLSGQLTLSLRPQTCTSPHHVHYTQQCKGNQHTTTQQRGYDREGTPGPVSSRMLRIRARLLARRDPSIVFPRSFRTSSFGRGGEPNLCNTALPPTRPPLHPVLLVVDLFPGSGRRTRERCCPTRYRTSQGCFLLPSQVPANYEAPLWLPALPRPPFSLDGLSVGPANWARPQVPASARVWSDGTVMGAVGRKRRRRQGRTDTCQRCAPPPSKIASCEVRWMTPGILRGPPAGRFLSLNKQATRAAKNREQGQAVIVPTMAIHSSETETGSAPASFCWVEMSRSPVKWTLCWRAIITRLVLTRQE